VNPEFFFKKMNQVLMGSKAKTTTSWQAKAYLIPALAVNAVRRRLGLARNRNYISSPLAPQRGSLKGF
jgi:hypothetical protein